MQQLHVTPEHLVIIIIIIISPDALMVPNRTIYGNTVQAQTQTQAMGLGNIQKNAAELSFQYETL
jgi:hypothetical protein